MMPIVTTTLPDGSIQSVNTDASGRIIWVSVAPDPGSAVAISAVNQATLQQQAQAALVANRADQTQDGTIQSGAATINATAGTFTLGQCTTFIKQLATAVSTNAGNDINTKKELNALIRLALQQFDATN